MCIKEKQNNSSQCLSRNLSSLFQGSTSGKKYQKFSQIRQFQLGFPTIMWKGTSQVCLSKKREIDITSSDHNFLWEGRICHLTSSAEMWVNALPHMRKWAQNSSINYHFWSARQNSPQRGVWLRAARGAYLKGQPGKWSRHPAAEKKAPNRSLGQTRSEK